MNIYIDADACPKAIKEILYKAAHKRKVTCIFVANQPLIHQSSPFIKSRCVDKGFDVADKYISNHVQQNDLVITADIPLAKSVIDKGAIVITPHGKKYTTSNISQALSMRNFFTELRDAGLIETKTKAFSQHNNHAFAAELDRYLTQKGRLPQ
ncbi:YaiI/YqxD family protein [Fastidiosibacter lacustris]|uniref:YaiI/YqxD family protein n=1 Tax=Fastidiosibacter lacustris TaxID=2056695 RepID=UPI000E3417BD|nr:YaiI/YqxD family protein [Fastidiosibacter lacustris]